MFSFIKEIFESIAMDEVKLLFKEYLFSILCALAGGYMIGNIIGIVLILIGLISLFFRFKKEQDNTIKGRVLYRFTHVSLNQIGNKLVFNTQLTFSSCSYSTIYCEFLTASKVQIDGKTFREEDYKTIEKDLKGLILPWQTLNKVISFETTKL